MENNKIEKNNSCFGKNENKSSRNRTVLEIGVERYVALGNLIQNWKIAFFTILGLFVLNIGVSVYLFTARTVYPYVVKVDSKSGEVISSEVLKSTSEVSKKEIEYFLRKFIIDTRMITKDKNFFDKNIKQANSFLTTATQTKIVTILSNEKVNTFFDNNLTRDIEILTFNVVPETKNTYQLRWREKEFDENGKLIKRRNMNAILRISFFIPSIEHIPINPFGIVITDYNQSQEN